MRLLVDTNVVLDVLLKRDPWAASASAISRDLEGFASTSITVLTPDSLLEHLGSANSDMTSDSPRAGSS